MGPSKNKINLSDFSPSAQNPPVKYGLPAEVYFCKRCVISNQRPTSDVEYANVKDRKKKTINFDEEGVCDACRVVEEKRKIDWADRERELKELCDRHRSKDGSYDCIVPGSGGKDSVYTAHMLKYKYGMNPLTVTWAPHIYTDWGWKNFQAWLHAGFDNVLHTPNGRVHRLLTRLAMENLFHPFQPFIIGQKATAPKVALQYNIPLVFYGENEAEYGNPKSDMAKSRQDWNYFTAADKSKIFLAGVSIAELKSDYGVTNHDLLPYLPANPEQVEKLDVQVHYMGYYLKWHPQSCYYYAVENAGFQASPERNAGTYSKYSSLDDKMDDFNFYTTYVKFGIGRASYDAAQEIRSGDILREEGVALVKRFDGEFPDRFAKEIFQYLSVDPKEFGDVAKRFEQPIVDKDYFMSLCDSFRSPHLWKNETGSWKLRKNVWENS